MEDIKKVPIEEEVKSAYIDYAMSVIAGRAIPDVRDGLKPVQRRILYSMYELGLLPNKPYKKSARVVGETLGKYHPHGDASVYDALVRMAQDFTMRYPLIEGQGNFGSIDGDPPAAMRYTEARLTKLAVEMLEDIDKNTVDMMPNFDASLEEPTVLPSKFPNLICNGTTGIAVGLATSIPPHNFTEVAEALKYVAEFPDATIEELFNFIKGPDFPTGGVITNTKEELIDIYKSSRGSITIKGKARIEKLPGNRQRIVIYEIPYQVNKVELIKKIAELVRTGKEKGISDLRDESDRTGIRIVIELKRDADAEKVLKKLYKSTPLEKNFPVNLTVLVDKQPRVLNLKELLQEFIKHRIEIITRRTLFELEKAENRLHIVEGLITALENADKVIEIVRSSKDTAQARDLLTSQFNLSETQANAILDMRLSRFTSLETQKLKDESTELKQKIERYKQILSSDDEKIKVFIEETDELLRKYGDQRKTTIATEKELTFKEHFMFAILNTGRIVNHKVEDETSKADILQRIINSLSISLAEGEKIVSIQEVEGSKPIAFFTKEGKAYWSLVIDLPKGEDKLRDFQKKALDYKDKSVILTASTGMGKTEFALNWVAGDKAFYTLPVRVSVNSMYERISNIFGKDNVGILHADTTDFYLNQFKNLEDNGIEVLINQVQSVRQLSMPITVSTADQIFLATLKYPSFEKIYATLTYSKVIVDEPQGYSPDTLAVIIKGLEEISNLGGKFCLMTATMHPFIKEHLKDKAEILEPVFNPEKKHKIKLVDKTVNKMVDFAIKEYQKGKKVLILTNTVRKAQEVYNALKDLKQPIKFNLLHSLYIQKTKREKEMQIQNTTEPVIWISTQIVEASLDIDYDLMITELSTADSLIQRMGRVYRKTGRAITPDSQPNIIICTKEPSGKGKVYDKEIVEYTLKELEKYDEKILTEEIKQEIVSNVFDIERIKNTNFYKKFDKNMKLLEYGFIADSKSEAQDIFRDIINLSVIPKVIFDENQEKINALLEKVRQKDKLEKIKAIGELNDFTVSAQFYRVKNIIPLDKEIFLSDIPYDDELGFNLLDQNYREIGEIL